MIWLLLGACSWSDSPSTPWIEVTGGRFTMGSESIGAPGAEGGEPRQRIHSRERPVHEVVVPSFFMMRHEVRVDTYRQCVVAGACRARPKGKYCVNLSDPSLAANCLDWEQASQVCAFLGGRLPTESEWEYVATSGGQPGEFPWGEAVPDCTRANLAYRGMTACSDTLWQVCTHPAGDTPWGFCEMGGNLFEWTEDTFSDTYEGHPTDGSARRADPAFRVIRGGGVGSDLAPRARQRAFHPPGFSYGGMGARCARSKK